MLRIVKEQAAASNVSTRDRRIPAWLTVGTDQLK